MHHVYWYYLLLSSLLFTSFLTSINCVFSINGENKHFGAPANPVALDRIAGGSSSGSAVAVSAGIVEFSLGKLFLLFALKILKATYHESSLIAFQ